jgi:hypothetical protein
MIKKLRNLPYALKWEQEEEKKLPLEITAAGMIIHS